MSAGQASHRIHSAGRRGGAAGRSRSWALPPSRGSTIDLVREVSWSNVRDKLNIGLFDAAHLLSPVAIASSLGIGHVRVPIVAPFNLGLNGNAITVSPRLFAALASAADGDIADPLVSARALARVVAERKARGSEPLTFGMTFPFSNHNYQLRFWMAAGGIDPDEDVRLVVLPPPYMVDSLANGQVDGFCVGAPWNSVAVESGVGRILHFGCEIMARAVGKGAGGARAVVERAIPIRSPRWCARWPAPSDFIDDAGQPAGGRGNAGAAARRADGTDRAHARRRTQDLDRRHASRADSRYIMIGGHVANRPDPVQAAWLYAQMVRWGQAPLSEDCCACGAGGVQARSLRRRARRARPRRTTASRATASAPSSDRLRRRRHRRLSSRPGASSGPAGRVCRSCAKFVQCTIFLHDAPDIGIVQ